MQNSGSFYNLNKLSDNYNMTDIYNMHVLRKKKYQGTIACALNFLYPILFHLFSPYIFDKYVRLEKSYPIITYSYYIENSQDLPKCLKLKPKEVFLNTTRHNIH